MVGLVRVATGVGGTQIGHTQRLGLSVLIRLVEESPFDHLGLVDTRLAEALHGQADALQTGGLCGVWTADTRAAVADDHGGALRRPFLGQRLDRARWDAADGCRPLRSLLHTVLFAHDVGLVFLNANGVSIEVFLVIGAVFEPLVRDGQIESRVGIRQDRDPPVGVHGRGIVEVWAHVDLLDAEFTPPVAEAAGKLALPTPRGRFLVAAPEQQQLGVLRHVIQQVALHDPGLPARSPRSACCRTTNLPSCRAGGFAE